MRVGEDSFDGPAGAGRRRFATMELAVAPFLYALATVSITFVGFSALLIVIRQSGGHGLTKYDTYFALSFIQAGLITTGMALLAPAIALGNFSPQTVWRIAGLISAAAILAFVISVPRRRRAATGGPAPTFIRISLTVQALTALALILNGFGAFANQGAVY